MNTYGKIVLENGQKVFKRFGAATKQKIKLGTAAFADIVSNPTKLDVGKVPDASFVAGQQEAIDELSPSTLWENPNPEEEFQEQDIVFNSNNYTRLEIFYKTGNQMFSQTIYKGFGTVISSGDGNGVNEHIRFRYRFVTYINDTKLHVSKAYSANYNSTTDAYQSLLVPFRIIGFNL